MNFCYETKPYKLIIPQRNITIQSINDLYYGNLRELESGVSVNKDEKWLVNK